MMCFLWVHMTNWHSLFISSSYNQLVCIAFKLKLDDIIFALSLKFKEFERKINLYVNLAEQQPLWPQMAFAG